MGFYPARSKGLCSRETPVPPTHHSFSTSRGLGRKTPEPSRPFGKHNLGLYFTLWLVKASGEGSKWPSPVKRFSWDFLIHSPFRGQKTGKYARYFRRNFHFWTFLEQILFPGMKIFLASGCEPA
jgi:hypothetical protein